MEFLDLKRCPRPLFSSGSSNKACPGLLIRKSSKAHFLCLLLGSISTVSHRGLRHRCCSSSSSKARLCLLLGSHVAYHGLKHLPGFGNRAFNPRGQKMQRPSLCSSSLVLLGTAYHCSSREDVLGRSSSSRRVLLVPVDGRDGSCRVSKLSQWRLSTAEAQTIRAMAASQAEFYGVATLAVTGHLAAVIRAAAGGQRNGPMTAQGDPARTAAPIIRAMCTRKKEGWGAWKPGPDP